MSKSSNVTFNFSGLLQVAFIVLKLTHYIDWSWWWVLAPMWAPLTALFVIFFLLSFISTIVKAL